MRSEKSPSGRLAWQGGVLCWATASSAQARIMAPGDDLGLSRDTREACVLSLNRQIIARYTPEDASDADEDWAWLMDHLGSE